MLTQIMPGPVSVFFARFALDLRAVRFARVLRFNDTAANSDVARPVAVTEDANDVSPVVSNTNVVAG